MESNSLLKKEHKVDLCVVGGGMAGTLAAISAARHGLSVVLMHDRPVLGGNASSEVRMWVLGCRGKNNREGGILEEILLENMHRNPTRSYAIWDSVLYEKVKAEDNITLLLNCSCNNLEMEGNKIKSIDGWQLNTYTWHHVEADYFVDSSGDSILAPLCGAEFRVGRESKDEFDEDIAPDVADDKVMGMACLISARETPYPVKYIPPKWAREFKGEDALPFRIHSLDSPLQNFWWIEYGGEMDNIHDTDEIRDELIKIAYGVWDHIKNHGDHGAENWDLDWVGFLPGKRESRRYVGDYILSQKDIQEQRKFEDIVAYGGWPLDVHHPKGIYFEGKPNSSYHAPTPFGIPYRCLYSKNIDNLMFAVRNISATHVAFSSCRVIATCAIIGQAVGTAVALASKNKILPRDIFPSKIHELKQILMNDDCFIPWNKHDISNICKNAKIISEAENVENIRNGIDRPIDEEDNGCYIKPGSEITYSLKEVTDIRQIRIVFDSNFDRSSCDGHERLRFYPSVFNRFLNMEPFGFPKTMVKSFEVSYEDENGDFHILESAEDNNQRCILISTKVKAKKITLKVNETYGYDTAHIFSFDFK